MNSDPVQNQAKQSDSPGSHTPRVEAAAGCSTTEGTSSRAARFQQKRSKAGLRPEKSELIGADGFHHRLEKDQQEHQHGWQHTSKVAGSRKVQQRQGSGSSRTAEPSCPTGSKTGRCCDISSSGSTSHGGALKLLPRPGIKKAIKPSSSPLPPRKSYVLTSPPSEAVRRREKDSGAR